MKERPSVEAQTTAREVVELDHDEAMRLLAGIDHGRVVFTHQALPAIRIVNHLVDEGRVIVRTRLTTTVSAVVRLSTERGVVVAYEADDLDPRRRSGWSVGHAGPATTNTRHRFIIREAAQWSASSADCRARKSFTTATRFYRRDCRLHRDRPPVQLTEPSQPTPPRTM